MGVAAWHAPRCVSPEQNTETPRKLRRGCGGAGLHWRRYARPGLLRVCVSARPTVSPGGRMGRGERREHTDKGRGTTHNSQAGPPTRPSRCERPWHMRAGLCSLTFSVVVVYFGCCLVAADASLCVHLSSVSVRQFSRVFVPESRATIEPISLAYRWMLACGIPP